MSPIIKVFLFSNRNSLVRRRVTSQCQILSVDVSYKDETVVNEKKKKERKSEEETRKMLYLFN